MKLTLPYPPSSNRYWRVWRGRAVKSNEARDYQRAVKLRGLAGKRADPLVGPVAIHVDVYRPARRGDLDNSLKVTLDAIQGVAYLNDEQIVYLSASRNEDAANPRVEVLVVAAEERAA